MKDGIRILDQAEKIRKTTNNVIRLYTSAPVCSKTKVYLNKNNILIDSIIELADLEYNISTGHAPQISSAMLVTILMNLPFE